MGHTPSERRNLLHLDELLRVEMPKLAYIQEQATSLSLKLLKRVEKMEKEERDAQDVLAVVKLLDNTIHNLGQMSEDLDAMAGKLRAYA